MFIRGDAKTDLYDDKERNNKNVITKKTFFASLLHPFVEDIASYRVDTYKRKR